MKEYIEREAVIEAFDDPAVEKYYGDVCPESVIRVIEQIPAADVRPVVMCRDCKHGQGEKMDFWNEYEGIECVGGVVHRKDFFCADGEKRAES